MGPVKPTASSRPIGRAQITQLCTPVSATRSAEPRARSAGTGAAMRNVPLPCVTLFLTYTTGSALGRRPRRKTAVACASAGCGVGRRLRCRRRPGSGDRLGRPPVLLLPLQPAEYRQRRACGDTSDIAPIGTAARPIPPLGLVRAASRRPRPPARRGRLRLVVLYPEHPMPVRLPGSTARRAKRRTQSGQRAAGLAWVCDRFGSAPFYRASSSSRPSAWRASAG